jgi:hypothetical protein
MAASNKFPVPFGEYGYQYRGIGTDYKEPNENEMECAFRD